MFVQKMFLKYIEFSIEKEEEKKGERIWGCVFVFQESMYLIIHTFSFVNEKEKRIATVLVFPFRHTHTHTLQSLIGKHLYVV